MGQSLTQRLGFVHLKSSAASQSSSQSSNPCVQRKGSHVSDRKGSRRRMDTEERKDKGTLFHHLKADARDLCWFKVIHWEKNHFKIIKQFIVIYLTVAEN